jgi:tetratricopeptide (TPR) repeat protein
VLSWLLAWTPSLAGWRWPAAGVALLAALLCKETAIALAPIAALGAWVRRDSRRALIACTLWPLAPLAVYLALRQHVIGSLIAAPELRFSPLDNPLVELAAGERVHNALVLLARSFFLLLWPAKLSADYSLASLPLVVSPGPWILALALHLALVTAAWLARRRAPAVTLGLAVFYLGLLPTSNLLFPSATIFAERFLLVPALAVALPAAWVLARARDRPRARAALAAILVAGAARTIARLPDWRDDLTLFRAVAASYPRNAKAHYNVAVLLQRQGEARAALDEARVAVEIYPRYGDARALLSQLLLAAGDPAAALEVARTGVALLPHHEDLWNQLGQLHLARGQLEQAHAAFAGGFAQLPASYRLPFNLAMMELAASRPDAALPLLRHVLARADLPDANYALGRILLERGDPAAARPLLEKGLRSRWGDDARALLALAHLQSGAPQAALDVLGRPASPQAALVGAVALLRVGRRTEGQAVLSRLGIDGPGGCPPPDTPLGDVCRAALRGSGP